MLAELEDYLKSDVVYWQVASNPLGARMPKMTIGGLLESLLRAEAGGAAGIDAMRAELETVKTRHLVRYLDRAEKETHSRLDAWKWYLDDVQRARADAADYYANEARSRLKAELLLGELEPERRGATERARATALDDMVRKTWTPGEFIWDERLKSFLPPDRFWWLYGRLKQRA
jgi:hypothetical protein